MAFKANFFRHTSANGCGIFFIQFDFVTAF